MSKKLNIDRISESNTVVEIKSCLDNNNVDYDNNMRKRELLKLVKGKRHWDKIISKNEDNGDNIKPKSTAILAHKVHWKGHKAGDRVSVTNREYKYLYKRNMIKR